MIVITMLAYKKTLNITQDFISIENTRFYKSNPFYRAIIAMRTCYGHCTHRTTSNGHICVCPDRVSRQSLLSHNPPNAFFHESSIFIPFYGIRKLSSVRIGRIFLFIFLIRYFIFILNPELENNFVWTGSAADRFDLKDKHGRHKG